MKPDPRSSSSRPNQPSSSAASQSKTAVSPAKRFEEPPTVYSDGHLETRYRKADITKANVVNTPYFRSGEYVSRSENDTAMRAFSMEPSRPSPKYALSLHRKESKTGLRIPLTISANHDAQDSFVTLPRTKSHSALPNSLKPSLAGPETRYEKPTGKRRRDGGRQQAVAARSLSPAPIRPDIIAPTQQEDIPLGEEIRSSFRSIGTISSSPVESSSTKRSSVLTKGTSVTDLMMDPQSRPTSKAGGGMTVDEAIDMYIAGFEDDPQTRFASSLVEEEQRRSARLTEAMVDAMGSSPSSQRSSALEPQSPNASDPRGLPSRDQQGPVHLMPPTTSCDQYGFLKASSHVTLSQYESWYREYLPGQERRAKKWVSYMREHGLSSYQPLHFPSKSSKTQRYVMKGIPPAWRGAAWFHYAGGQALIDQDPGLYLDLTSCTEAELSDNEKEAIERDLHRTFPDNIHFKFDQDRESEPALIGSLRRVLRAFALHSPKIGYCQSLNFIAGLLLLFMTEQKAFIMLHIITEEYLPGTHSLNLEGANTDLWVLMLALKSTSPAIWAVVGQTPVSDPSTSASSPRLNSSLSTSLNRARKSALPAFSVSSASLPPISLSTTSWFMSLFISVLPIETTLRIWDMLFYENNPRTLFRAAVAIFRLGEKRIFSTANAVAYSGGFKDASVPSTPNRAHGSSSHRSSRSLASVSDSAELFQVVQTLPKSMLDATGFMDMLIRQDKITGSWVHDKRKWIRHAKEREEAYESRIKSSVADSPAAVASPPLTPIKLPASVNTPSTTLVEPDAITVPTNTPPSRDSTPPPPPPKDDFRAPKSKPGVSPLMPVSQTSVAAAAAAVAETPTKRSSSLWRRRSKTQLHIHPTHNSHDPAPVMVRAHAQRLKGLVG